MRIDSWRLAQSIWWCPWCHLHHCYGREGGDTADAGREPGTVDEALLEFQTTARVACRQQKAWDLFVVALQRGHPYPESLGRATLVEVWETSRASLPTRDLSCR